MHRLRAGLLVHLWAGFSWGLGAPVALPPHHHERLHHREAQEEVEDEELQDGGGWGMRMKCCRKPASRPLPGLALPSVCGSP